MPDPRQDEEDLTAELNALARALGWVALLLMAAGGLVVLSTVFGGA